MLAGHGHQVTVFVNDDRVRTHLVTPAFENIRLVRFNPAQFDDGKELGHVTRIAFGFASIVKAFIRAEGKPDLIESQEYLGIAYYLLRFRKLLYDWCQDIPVQITIHSPSFLYLEYNEVPLYRYPNYWIGEMERFCLLAADHLVSPSLHITREISQRFPLNSGNLSVIPNPFQVGQQHDSASTTNAAGTGIYFYGKLSVQKGTFLLLSYMEGLWQNGFDQPLTLVGGQDIVYHPEGRTMGEIVRRDYRNRISSGLLKLKGQVSPARMASTLTDAKVVIVPSNHDNLPYVVMEMMAMGKIVLVSKQGGQSEIVTDGIDGFVFDHNVPETFAESLLKICSLPDAELLKISLAARERIAHAYNFETIYNQRIRVIEHLIEAALTKQGRTFPHVHQVPGTDRIDTRYQGTDGLTVIVPFFNMGQWVLQTVHSILSSDYESISVLVINDGSTDKESLSKLAGLRQQKGVTVFDQANKGLAASRNTGAAMATTKYIAFLDADDTVEAGYYSRAIRVLEHYHNVSFAGCWTRYFGDSEKVWATFDPEPPLLLYHNLVNSSALVYKRDHFMQSGMNDTGMSYPGLEDYESVIAMTASGRRGIVLPEVLFNYRVRHNSMIRDLSQTKRVFLFDEIARRHQDFFACYTQELLAFSNANGQGLLLDDPSADLDAAGSLPFGKKFGGFLIKIIKKNRHAKKAALMLYRALKMKK